MGEGINISLGMELLFVEADIISPGMGSLMSGSLVLKKQRSWGKSAHLSRSSDWPNPMSLPTYLT